MSYRNLDLSQDVQSIVSAINEVVSITGSVFSVNDNVKFFRNIASASAGNDLGGYWESVYDSSPTSSLSTALFDITYGFTTSSVYNTQVTVLSSLNEKTKMYRHFASALLGNPDSTFNIGSVDRTSCFFLTLKRDLQKDEIKKGATSICINSTAPAQYSASDQGATVNFKQAVGGDYAPLKYNGTGSEVGQVWYNAGVIVIPADTAFGAVAAWSGSTTLINAQYSGTINNLVDGFRTHVERVDFHNQTNLYSTVYFCRAYNTDFNYSSNPTFVDDNKRIRVTSGSNILQTRTYITTVGLYDANDNLLAVGKVNKPLTKSPDNEVVLRVRVDY